MKRGGRSSRNANGDILLGVEEINGGGLAAIIFHFMLIRISGCSKYPPDRFRAIAVRRFKPMKLIRLEETRTLALYRLQTDT